ncbi:hypothetical protein NL50_16480 [Clostridium acetobutylicum]|nr:hypothetical protein NL50_16480 [Clostridium acetobutylicum]
MNKRVVKVEYIFMAFALFFGVLFAVINAPFQDPDEPIHFYRAYQISTGQMFEQKNNSGIGGYLPQNLIKTSENLSEDIKAKSNKKQDINKIKYYLNLPLNKNKVAFNDFRSATIYSDIVYIPQSIGINLAKIFRASALYMMYFGRIANLICWTIIVFFSVKLIPFKKNLMAFLALTPMNLYQAASLSADAMTNSMAFLSIALVLRYAFGEEEAKLTKRQIVTMIIAFTLLAFSKRIYFVMCILFFIIPMKKFNSKKDYIGTFVIMLGACLMSLVTVSVISKILAIKVSAGSYTPGQMEFVLSHPITYIHILLRTFHFKMSFYAISFIGVFGWLDTRLPLNLYLFYGVALVLIALFEHTLIEKNKDRIIMFIVFIINVGLIMSALYVSWTPKAANIIEGIQGRYFIPIIPLLGCFIGVKANKSRNVYSKVVLAISTFTILTYSVLQLLLRFYGIRIL